MLAPVDTTRLRRRIRVALGQEPGDLVLTGAQIANVFTEEIHPANIVIADGWIAGVGPYDWRAAQTIDLRGKVVLPGLVEAHMHLESTLLMPAPLAPLLVSHGTTTVVADPHEVGNVLGIPGIRMLLEASEGLPIDYHFMASSCVPAVSWEHAGAVLGPAEVERLLAMPRVLGLAEVMDFPAVLGGKAEMLDKILAAQKRRVAVDGHAPHLTGQRLVAYAAAGVRSDHESTTTEEALQKAALGMLVQVREGSSEHNLDTLLPLVAAGKLGDWCLCSDDVHPDDLMSRGHLDSLLGRVVAGGVPAVTAVRHSTLVPARHYGLRDCGAVAPAYRADLFVVHDVREFRPHLVVKDGGVVARDGEYLAKPRASSVPAMNTVRPGAVTEAMFTLVLSSEQAPVIGLIPGQIVTRRETHTVRRESGRWGFDPDRDVVMVASVERHRATGNVGLGLIRGLGLRKPCAIGSSAAHDSHNLIIAGTNPRDMAACVKALTETCGGWVVVADGEVKASLPLPVAGLMSTQDAPTVVRQLEELHTATRLLGCPLPYPFGTLSFAALSVIPELRITDQGLFDVNRQEFVHY